MPHALIRAKVSSWLSKVWLCSTRNQASTVKAEFLCPQVECSNLNYCGQATTCHCGRPMQSRHRVAYIYVNSTYWMDMAQIAIGTFVFIHAACVWCGSDRWKLDRMESYFLRSHKYRYTYDGFPSGKKLGLEFGLIIRTINKKHAFLYGSSCHTRYFSIYNSFCFFYLSNLIGSPY